MKYILHIYGTPEEAARGKRELPFGVDSVHKHTVVGTSLTGFGFNEIQLHTPITHKHIKWYTNVIFCRLLP